MTNQTEKSSAHYFVEVWRLPSGKYEARPPQMRMRLREGYDFSCNDPKPAYRSFKGGK